MGGQRFCVVTRDVDEETYRNFPCTSGRHIHIGWSEINDLWDDGELEPVGDKPGFDGGVLEKRRAGDGELRDRHEQAWPNVLAHLDAAVPA